MTTHADRERDIAWNEREDRKAVNRETLRKWREEHEMGTTPMTHAEMIASLDQSIAAVDKLKREHAEMVEALRMVELTLAYIGDSPIRPMGRSTLMAIAERERVRAILARIEKEG